MFINANSVTLCQTSVFAKLSGCQKWGFRKENCFFVSFYVGDRETEKKTKWKKANRTPIKIVCFKGGHPKMRKIKKLFVCFFFFQKLPDTICVRKGEKRIFVHTIGSDQEMFWTNKTVQTRKNYKNRGFSRKCPKPKMTSFFKRCFCDMGEKLGFTKYVFEKLCSSENTIFIVFSAKHCSCNKKLYVEENRKFMQNSGLILNMAKWCFLACCLRF